MVTWVSMHCTYNLFTIQTTCKQQLRLQNCIKIQVDMLLKSEISLCQKYVMSGRSILSKHNCCLSLYVAFRKFLNHITIISEACRSPKPDDISLAEITKLKPQYKALHLGTM